MLFDRVAFRYCIGLVLVLLAGVSYGDAGEAGSVGSGGREVEQFNYILGTQTFGVKYSFTDKTRLIETAEAIYGMGSNHLKFSMSPRSAKSQYSLGDSKTIKSLRQLAEDEPSVRTVLDMPFAYYHIWVYCFGGGAWQDGLSAEESERQYKEIFELTVYLLKKYNGSGKSFFLGHWEGDWYLHPGYDRTRTPDPEVVKNMIAWLKNRQKAVDDAKSRTPHENVNVYHYTEVNLVQKGIAGKSCLVNDVLPYSNVDYVSYSAYDTVIADRGKVKARLTEALDYIESKLPAKDGIEGKRVFIGEYGFPLQLAKTGDNQDAWSRDVCAAGLEWGCPFVLYWEMYCNEIVEGKHRGFWLINDKNEKQPFYHTLNKYYAECRAFIRDFQSTHNRLPTDKEFRKEAIRIISGEDG